MKEFSRALGNVLHRPAWGVLPGFAARLMFGQVADEVLLASQHAIPERLVKAGFAFELPDLATALETMVRGENPTGA
jgi:NAD dependent epimerase/dehydratase family enzyme